MKHLTFASDIGVITTDDFALARETRRADGRHVSNLTRLKGVFNQNKATGNENGWQLTCGMPTGMAWLVQTRTAASSKKMLHCGTAVKRQKIIGGRNESNAETN